MKCRYYAFGEIYDMRSWFIGEKVGVKVMDMLGGKCLSLSNDEYEKLCEKEIVAEVVYLKYRKREDKCLRNLKVFLEMRGADAVFALPSGKIEYKNATQCVENGNSRLLIANFDDLLESLTAKEVAVDKEAYKIEHSYVKIFSDVEFEVENTTYKCFDFSEYNGGSILNLGSLPRDQLGFNVLVAGGSIKHICGAPKSRVILILLPGVKSVETSATLLPVCIVQTGSKLADELLKKGCVVIQRDLSTEFWKIPQRMIDKIKMVSDSDNRFSALFRTPVYLNLQSEIKNLKQTLESNEKFIEAEFNELMEKFKPNEVLQPLADVINKTRTGNRAVYHETQVNFLLKSYLRYREDIGELLVSYGNFEDNEVNCLAKIVSIVGDCIIYKISVCGVCYDIVTREDKICSAFVSFIVYTSGGNICGAPIDRFNLCRFTDTTMAGLHNVKFQAGDMVNFRGINLANQFHVVGGHITTFPVLDCTIPYGFKRELHKTEKLNLNLNTGQLYCCPGGSVIKKVYESTTEAEAAGYCVGRHAGAEEMQLSNEIYDYMKSKRAGMVEYELNMLKLTKEQEKQLYEDIPCYMNCNKTDGLYTELKMLTTNGKFMLRIAGKYKTAKSLLEAERESLDELGYITDDTDFNIYILDNLIKASIKLKNLREGFAIRTKIIDEVLNREETTVRNTKKDEYGIFSGCISVCGQNLKKSYEKLYGGFAVNLFNGEVVTYVGLATPSYDSDSNFDNEKMDNNVVTGRFDSLKDLREVYGHSSVRDIRGLSAYDVVCHCTDADLAMSLSYWGLNIEVPSRLMVKHYRDLIFANITIPSDEDMTDFKFIKKYKDWRKGKK